MTGITPPSAVPHYHHGHLRQALLDAAYALLREWPAAQLKLRQVARAAKVSHTASYHYFPDRTALLRALGDECMRRMVWRQQQALAAVADPGRAPIEVGLDYIGYAASEPNAFSLQFDPQFSPPDASSTERLQLVERQRDILAAATAQARQAGTLPPNGDPDALTMALWGVVHGIAQLAHAGILPAAAAEPALRAWHVEAPS